MVMIMKIKYVAVGVFAGLVLSACQAIQTPIDEDYQFGDTTSSVIQLQAKYCAETDPIKRALYLKALKSVVPNYPERGACTDLVELIGEEGVQGIADGVSDVDVAEAIEEQKKYQEKLNNQ